MRVLYLMTSAPPPLHGTDAVFQEVAALRKAVPGELFNLCPRTTPGAFYPPQLLGLHLLPALRQAEKRCDVTHIYFSVPYYFPLLRFMRNPVVFTAVASLAGRPPPAHIDRLNGLRHIAVSNQRDADILRGWGLSNGAVVPPAIDVSIRKAPALSPDRDITLLMASAPWTEEQFDTKGVDALLDAAARDSSIKLILLWRGLFEESLRARIARLDIEDQVEVVTDHVDINDYLQRAHAAVLLAKRSDIVKAYPNSLMEALLASRPVIVTEALPIADYVRKKDCGIVAQGVTGAAILEALKALRDRYQALTGNARAIEAAEFSREAMVETYRAVYEL